MTYVDINTFSYIEIAALYGHWDLVKDLTKEFKINDLVFDLAMKQNKIDIIKIALTHGHKITKEYLDSNSCSNGLVKLCTNYGIFPTTKTLNGAIQRSLPDLQLIELCWDYRVVPTLETLNIAAGSNFTIFNIVFHKCKEYNVFPNKDTMKYAIINNNKQIIDELTSCGIELKPETQQSNYYTYIDKITKIITGKESIIDLIN